MTDQVTLSDTPDYKSAVQAVEIKRRRVVLIIVLAAIVLIVGACFVDARFMPSNRAVDYRSDVDHFKYGSIGSENESGLPYWVWRALPQMYPAVFKGQDFSVFGFQYETDANGKRRDLPIGISRRIVHGIELAWMNCAICHTGAVRKTASAEAVIIPGMPSNTLNLHDFVVFVLSLADDPKMQAPTLIPAIEKAGARLDWIDRLVWRFVIIPRIHSALQTQSAELSPLLAAQPAWGPGRVDTFNPYKLTKFHVRFQDLTEQERIGTADFPSIFNQRPREGMHLHWDGNNDSLAERNLSAALGAGVTEASIDHAGIDRVANWLLDLRPPPSPYTPDAEKVKSGQAIFMAQCAACHGRLENGNYVFEGATIGQVVPNAKLDMDPWRLNSYTQAFRDLQLTLFADDPLYHFKHFTKTDGYANVPLDGLWLRAPYLHNGSVPTLADLLAPPADRPKTFIRGGDVLDPDKGGFQAPPCTPGQPGDSGFCYDTAQNGNGNGGHLYGTTLSDPDKASLLAYLLTL